MVFTCNICNKEYKQKLGLTKHLKGYNKCGMDTLKQEYEDKIKQLELENKELLEKLINKPTIVNNDNRIDNSITNTIEKIECTITSEDYWNNKSGLFLTYEHVKERKYEKLVSIIVNTISKNFKGFSYYYILSTFCKEKDISDSVLIKDENRGNLELKFSNKVDSYTKVYQHEELDYQFKRIHTECLDIISKINYDKLKYFKSHSFYMNKLRLKLNKEGKTVGNTWKQKKEELLCIQNKEEESNNIELIE